MLNETAYPPSVQDEIVISSLTSVVCFPILSLHRSSRPRRLDTTLSWLSSTPLGLPVVPLVLGRRDGVGLEAVLVVFVVNANNI